MKRSSIVLMAVIAALCFVGPAAQASIVTFDMQASGDGTYELFAHASLGDNFGIAYFNADLVNILTATHESPRALDMGTGAVRGFTIGRADLAGPGALFAGQNTTDLATLIYGIGQTPGSFSTLPFATDVGVPWDMPVLLASGPWDTGGPSPAFGNEVLANIFTEEWTSGGIPAGLVVSADVVLVSGLTAGDFDLAIGYSAACGTNCKRQ